MYGHEQGLRLVWRGGRPLKEDAQISSGQPKSNGEGQDAVMINLDSSDEEPPKETTPKDQPLFQDEEEECDPSEPYEPIIQTLDLPLGVGVLHLSFPRLHQGVHDSNLPTILSEKAVIALACSDLSIRIIAVPLRPPSANSKRDVQLRDSTPSLVAGRSLFGEQMITLSSGTTHQSIPKGVSISMTAALPEDPEELDLEDVDEDTTRRPLSRRTSRSRSVSGPGKDQSWDLLVASHSADLSGLLLIHRIPLVEGNRVSDEMHIPWRKQYLASPAVSVDFCSALYPSSRHSQLLVADTKGAVRLYDCLPKSTAARGSWLLSLYTDFETPENSLPRRKPILDAQWVLGGKAILVLQADGKWGIWDYEGHGPIPTQPSTSSTNKSASLLTTYAIEGWISSSLIPQPLVKASNARMDSRSKLAPMTPGTRKMKQDALFSTPSHHVSNRPARGGLCVAPVPNTMSARPDDESVLLWYDTTAVVIPSLFTHWQNKARGSGNLFGSGAKGEPKTISNIRLGGEHCNVMNSLSKTQSKTSAKDNNPSQIPILVTGEKRLLIITPPLKGPETPEAVSPAEDEVPSTLDQQLLAKGELDVSGMDRILARMSNGHTLRRSSLKASKGRNLLSI